MKNLRSLSVAIVLAVLGLVYAQPVEVVWWDFLGGGDGVRMKALIDEFNATHDDIQINGTTLDWGVPYYTKVQTSVAVGESPDIMTYHLSRFPSAVPQGLLRPFSEEELAGVGLSLGDYFEGEIEKATVDGQVYGIPLDIHAIVLYYNKEILGSVGLLDENGLPAGFDGLDNFNAAMQKIKDEAGVIPLSIEHGSGTAWRIFYSLLGQQGASFIEGNEVVAGEAGVTALQTMTDWVSEGLASDFVDYNASKALFASGEAAMHINGVWEVPTWVDFAAAGELFEWGAIEIPTLFAQPATWADSHAFVIPNSEARPVEGEKLQAVLEVISWMNKNSLFWATAGHIPGYAPVVASDEYQAMEPNATYASLANNVLFDPDSPVAGVASPTYDAAGNLLVPALSGQLPVERAIQMMKQELESQLR